MKKYRNIYPVRKRLANQFSFLNLISRLLPLAIFSLFLSSSSLNAQNKFNKIIEDPGGNYVTTVVSLDTGYVVVSGTGNEYNTRCFALTYLDFEGNKKWKKLYDGGQYTEYWESKSKSLKKNNNIFFNVGHNYNMASLEMKGFLYIYDSLLNIKYKRYPFTVSNDTSGIRFTNVIQYTDGSFYISGQLREDINRDKTKLLLLKTDSEGNYLWHKTIDSYHVLSGDDIIQSSDNNLVIRGGCYDRRFSDRNWYLLKIDTSGNVLWERTFGSPKYFEYSKPEDHDLIETQDSNYLTSGLYPVAGNSIWIHNYFKDGCLRKIDKSGNLIWEKFYRNYSYAETSEGEVKFINSWINTIFELENGDVMVLGGHWHVYATEQAHLMRVDKNGNIKWHRNYYGGSVSVPDQYLLSIQQTKDKGFIMAGYGNGYDFMGYDPPQQMWVVKTDSLGMDGHINIAPDLLNIDIEIPDTVYLNEKIEVYAYIAGKSAPYSIEFSTGQTIDSIFYPPKYVPVEIGLGYVLARYGASHSFEETITEATLKNHEWGKCIAKPIELKTPQTTGYHDIEITVSDCYGETKSINKRVFVKDKNSVLEADIYADITLYPNPAKDILNIKTSDAAKYKTATIYDSLGRELKRVTLTSDITSINISDLSEGFYIVKLLSAEKEEISLSFEKISR